ncbi:MAG: T7SS effector LXG polymorphic toxin [ANME-2 cluster archaeon]|nr:T7SS effector LXG polymorphic toxin [ANME-2 cluster archaeon]
MTLFKKSSTSSKQEDVNQDIDFLKQNIKGEIEQKRTKPGGSIPKLSDILGNTSGTKSDFENIDFKPKTIEEHGKENVSQQIHKTPATSTTKSESTEAIASAAPTKPEAKATTLSGIKDPDSPATPETPKPEAKATTLSGIKVPDSPATPETPKPEAKATTLSGLKVPGSPATPETPKPEAKATPANSAQAPVMAQDSLNDLQSQLDNQKKLFDEQSKIIKSLETTIKDLESKDVDQLVTKNQELLKQLSQRLDDIEQAKASEGDETGSDEEKALIKAGKYLENHLNRVNEVSDKLDNKISDMRKFMSEVDEKESKFTETEDKLNKIQRKAENIIESELLGKSNEAIKALEDSKTKFVEESEQVIKNEQDKLEAFKSEIESFKQNAKGSIDSTIDNLRQTEREVKNTIDKKIEYESEQMKRVDEVISIMNEAVKKILGREEKEDEETAV